MKIYVPETTAQPEKKKKKGKKKDQTTSTVTKKDFGLTENAKVIME